MTDLKYEYSLVADELAEKYYGKDYYELDEMRQLEIYQQAMDEVRDRHIIEADLRIEARREG